MMCERYGRVIVLEDDLEVSSKFLEYVNHALETYELDQRVMQISAHCFPAAGFENSDGASFLPVSTTLGWGTWKRAWDRLDVGTRGIEVLSESKALKTRFDLENAYPYSRLLWRVTTGHQRARSWGIHWYWTISSCERWPSEITIDWQLYEALRRYHLGQRSLVRRLGRLVRSFAARVTG